MLCGSVFAANTLSVSSITDDGAGNVTISLGYMFEDEVGGFQFDFRGTQDFGPGGGKEVRRQIQAHPAPATAPYRCHAGQPHDITK